MSDRLTLGIFAASSAVPQWELQAGVQRLRGLGFECRVADQCAHQSFTFAGTDAARAEAFYRHAQDDAVAVLYAARGGYGASRILPLLEELTRRMGTPPRKLLVGYSDVTVLHEFVRRWWGWETLHAPMPAASNYGTYNADEFAALLALMRRQRPAGPWLASPLRPFAGQLEHSVEGKLIGGNLTLWSCLMGTPYQPQSAGGMLFFEDIGEAWYRVDRMVTQMLQAGAFEGVRAILLGDFTDCNDEKTMVTGPDGVEKVALRKVYEPSEAMAEIFGNLHARTGIPILSGMPVGHGPHFSPLPLGAKYRLDVEGKLELLRWGWLRE